MSLFEADGLLLTPAAPGPRTIAYDRAAASELSQAVVNTPTSGAGQRKSINSTNGDILGKDVQPPISYIDSYIGQAAGYRQADTVVEDTTLRVGLKNNMNVVASNFGLTIRRVVAQPTIAATMATRPKDGALAWDRLMQRRRLRWDDCGLTAVTAPLAPTIKFTKKPPVTSRTDPTVATSRAGMATLPGGSGPMLRSFDYWPVTGHLALGRGHLKGIR